MKIECFTTGPLFTNCYFITNNEKTIVIDPGMDLEKHVDISKYDIDAIFLTHGHIDHIASINKISAPIYIYSSEASFLTNNRLNLAEAFGLIFSFTNTKKITLLNDKDTFILNDLNIKVIHTPGHTSGSCSYLINNQLFTGDTLFQAGQGRTDFYTGNYQEMKESILKLIDNFPDELEFHAGHGESSTIGFEKKYNEFYKQYKK